MVILDARKLPLIGFLAISEQYATFWGDLLSQNCHRWPENYL